MTKQKSIDLTENVVYAYDYANNIFNALYLPKGLRGVYLEKLDGSYYLAAGKPVTNSSLLGTFVTFGDVKEINFEDGEALAEYVSHYNDPADIEYFPVLFNPETDVLFYNDRNDGLLLDRAPANVKHVIATDLSLADDGVLQRRVSAARFLVEKQQTEVVVKKAAKEKK